MEPNPAADFVFPGMKVGCLPYQALANSTLECFFSATCLNDSAPWISNLPAVARSQPMNGSSMVLFSPNTSLSVIFANKMLDHWENTTSFSRYYQTCEPVQCTFTTTRKNSFIHLLTLLLGLYGGLTVALRIAAPSMVRLGRFVFSQFKKRRTSSSQNQQTGISKGTTNSSAETANGSDENALLRHGIISCVLA